MKVKEKSIEDYKFDEHNFNQHTEEGMELLDKSIEQFGFGRSTLADKNGVMVGGNGVLETARKQGKTKVIEVETDGTELVVVKRKDIDINTKKGRELAYADNKIAQTNLKWNEEQMEYAEQEYECKIEDWGGEIDRFDVDLNDIDNIQEKGFLRHVRDEQDVFQMTVLLPISCRAKLNKYLNNKEGKQIIINKILELCQ